MISLVKSIGNKSRILRSQRSGRSSKSSRSSQKVPEVEPVRQDVTVLHFSGALDPICSNSNSSNSEKKLWYFPILDFFETWHEVIGQ